MLVRDENGCLIYEPRGLCFVEGDDGDGGAGGDTQAGGEGDGADTQAGGDGGDGGKTKLTDGDTVDGGDTGTAKSWRDGITDPDLQKVAAKYNTPGDLAKAYREAEKRLGKSITVPGDGASEEEKAAFLKAVGVPEKPEDYKVTIPDEVKESWGEADEALKTGFLKSLHAAGATPAVAEAAMGWYFEASKALADARQKEEAKATEKAQGELRTEWGDDYKANATYAQRAFKEFGGEEFTKLVQSVEVGGVKLDAHPVMLKAFSAVGRAMAEDRPLAGGDTDAAKSVQDRIDELHALQDTDPTQYRSSKVQTELQTLYKKLYGTAPADGRAA